MLPVCSITFQTMPEVQMVAVGAIHVKEIQRFITYADPYETVGGFWSLYYPGESMKALLDTGMKSV